MESSIKELEKNYEPFFTKYKLPSFRDLNEAFEIEKIDKESQTFLRVIRKIIMEKVANSFGFVDMLLNPANAPRMYYSYIKSMSDNDKKILEKIYNLFSDLIVKSLFLEVNYSEREEASLIKESFEVWGSMKNDFGEVLQNIISPKNNIISKGKSYFG